MGETTNVIVEAASDAISIIIVGVGNADFSAMDVLDGDEVRLKSSRGKEAERDIVQFVKFNDFKAQGCGSLLAAEVLREIPD